MSIKNSPLKLEDHVRPEDYLFDIQFHAFLIGLLIGVVFSSLFWWLRGLIFL